MEIEKKIGSLEENARWQNKKLDSIEQKVDSLVDLKGKIIGACIVISFITTLIVSLAELSRAGGH